MENEVFLKCELELVKLEFKNYLMAEDADGNLWHFHKSFTCFPPFYGKLGI